MMTVSAAVPAGSSNTEIEVKTLDGLTVKNEERGEIRAVIATLDVVDRDHDIIRKGAIPDGARVKISDYGHSAVFGVPPVGKGVLRIKSDQAILEGTYFMSTDSGVQAFRRMKEIGMDDQEWSVGFIVIGSELPSEEEMERGAWRVLTKLDSFEVSPVLRGAGINTGTVAVKSAAQGALKLRASAAAVTQPKVDLAYDIERFERREAQLAAEAKAAEIKAEVLREIKRFERRELLRKCLDEPLGALAWNAAEEGARWLSHGGLQEGPAVVWFDDDGRAKGWFHPSRPDEIRISRSLKTAREVVATVMHEVSHWWAIWDPSEERAEFDSKRLTNRYFQKFPRRDVA